jgi:glycopeptide antibiotics resistance protein
VRGIFAQSTPLGRIGGKRGSVDDRGRVILWALLICACVVPWTDFQNHSHWARVQWIPFVTPPIKRIDILVNVALYLPLGYWFARWLGRRRFAVVLGCATVLSLFTEWTQLYSHSRFPSLTDVTCNLIGTVAGIWLAAQISRLSSEKSA